MTAPRRRVSLPRALAEWGGGRLASLLLLAVALWALSTMRRSPTWRVQWVEVSGCDLVSPEQVVQASELADAWSVALVPEAVAAKVRSLPGIVEAQASVGWPSRVRIAVQEDVPLATVVIGDQELWATKQEGLVSPYGQVQGLPRLRLVGHDGGPVQITERVLEGLEAMRVAFPDREEYVYHADRGFEIQSERGYPVYLGDASNLDTRLAILAALESDLAAEQYAPQFVDISTIDGAYYQ